MKLFDDEAIKVFDRFIFFYQHYFDRKDRADTIARINNGDCGTAALAIGHVLRSQGYDVKYYDNTNHAFLVNDNKAYDTAHLTGTSISFLNHLHSSDLASEVNYRELVEGYIPYDALGATFILMFYKYYDVDVPEEILAIVAKSPEYDEPEFINLHISRLLPFVGPTE